MSQTTSTSSAPKAGPTAHLGHRHGRALCAGQAARLQTDDRRADRSGRNDDPSAQASSGLVATAQR
jgi:hypothetical protein